MKKEIFRQAAIDQVSTPDRLDEMLTVTAPRDWLVLAAIGTLLAAAIVWGREGRIARKADGQGVLLLAGGVVNVVAGGAGRVRDLKVKTGDHVECNQVIGSISQPDAENKLKALRESLAELQSERARAGTARTEGLHLQDIALANQRDNHLRQIADLEQQIKVMGEQIQVDEELLGKGLITRQQVLDSRQKRNAAQSSIASLEAELKQIDSTRFQNEAQVSMADRDAEARINEVQRSIDLMQKELAESTAIKSPYTGKVIELKTYAGSLVTAGEPVISLEPSSDQVEVVLYISSAKVKEIHAGMAAEVTPTSTPREEYGFIRGRVTSVAEFPATRAAVLRNFENESLVSALAAAGPVNEVRVSLESDTATQSGFKWSSSKGPAMRITSGTLCVASIVTHEQTPLSLVIPFLKEKVGLN